MGLRGASREILGETRKVIGEYQPAMGPYAAMAPLADSTKAERASLGFPEDEPELRTGELHDSYKMDASGMEGGVGSASKVALAQEMGNSAKNLPGRHILGFGFLRAEKKAFELFCVPIFAALRGARIP
jgi:hypothetical protein